jgi:type VI secretion system secreted protein Hcp
MATDMFIKIKDVPGESTDDKHKGEIEVLQWSWGLAQSGSFGTGAGSGAGKVSASDLSFTHFMDKASPVLMRLCSNGKHIPEANLVMRLAGEKQLEYLKIKLEQVFVSNVSLGGSGGAGDKLTESVTLRFAKIKVDYFPQTEKGALDAAVPYGWDFQKNVSVA